MSDQADIGQGILFQRETAVAGTYATVPGLITPALPKLSRDMIDSTDTESPDRYREFIAGLKSGGELPLEFELLLGDTSQALLYTDFEAKSPHNYRMVGNDTATTTWSFSGYVSGIEPATPLDGKMTLSVTITISGKPTLS